MVLKNLVAWVFYGLLGRKQGVRTSNFLLNWGRFDLPNNMRFNGEKWVQHRVASLPSDVKVVFDVGANLGEWSESFLEQAPPDHLKQIKIVAFEALPGTFRLLEKKMVHAMDHVTLVQSAVGRESGEATFFSYGTGVGVNSLHNTGHTQKETVPLVSIDDYCLKNGISKITFLKSDVEGADFAVLQGAGRLIAKQNIDVIQFEYNHRWIWSRTYLKDAFEFLEGHKYTVGKITPKGVHFYDKWEPNLESFREANFFACKPELAKYFKR